MGKLTSGYPEDIGEQATYINRNYFDVLISMNDLFHSSQRAFEQVIDPYPDKTKKAYDNLVKLPEVISILTENMNMTVLLGDTYKNHPDALMHELDSLNVVVAEQKTKELNEWKQSLEEDSGAMSEYEEESQEFASEQGYNESDYTCKIYN